MHRSTILLTMGAFSSPVTADWFKSNQEPSWKPPQQTGIYGPEAGEDNQLALGWSPKPTDAPSLDGAMDLGFVLGKRALKSTVCGFGPEGNSFTCVDSRSAVCNYSSNFVGCCETGRSCNSIKTTCIDYASSASICNFLEDFHTLCCDKSAPSCYTWAGTSDGTDYTLLACSAKQGSSELIFSDPLAESTTSTSSESSTSSEASSTTSSAAASSSSADNDDDGGSSTPVGAIAGGVVGGVAALGLVALAGFLLFRRRKKPTPAATSQADDGNQPPMAQNPQNPQSPGSFVPSSPSNAAYPSGVPSNFQGGYQQTYDPSLAAPYGQPQGYSQPGYSGYSPQPQAFQGHYAPQQGFGQQGQYPSGYGAGGYGAPSTSPPPHFTPSPGPNKDGEIPQGGHQQHNAQELPTVNPLGNEGNRAELS